jgi:thiamine biosynthesis lipoprotein
MNGKLSKVKILFLIFLIVGTFLILRNRTPEVYTTNSGYIFGTQYNIKYKSVKDLHNEVKATLMQVDNSLSMFNKSSLISAFNSNRDTIANEMFTEVFNLAQEISKKTDGAFDITVAPLVNAWGFGFKKGELPDSATVEELRSKVGYTTVALIDGKVVKQNPGTMLDCGAIAKGYGCDMVARLLDSRNITDYMIEIGGEVVTKGKNDRGTDWNISISKPTENTTGSHNGHQRIIAISGKAMATSGNYRNFRIENGKKYAHTIDPRTGYPVQHSLLSATVIASDCMRADALATAFMVLGVDSAMAYCKRYPDVEGYFIVAADSGRYAIRQSFEEGKYK